MFLEQQISILEWFLKDHVTLKTGAMAVALSLIIFQNITVFNVILHLGKCSLKWDFFQKHKKKKILFLTFIVYSLVFHNTGHDNYT